MGGSLLSLVEIVYHCILKRFFFKDAPEEPEIEEVVETKDTRRFRRVIPIGEFHESKNNPE